MKKPGSPRQRLAIVVSHPIQYYAPWFAYLAENLPGPIRVFYLWDFGVRTQMDRGFRCPVTWDVDLLAGYDSTFVENVANDRGTHHFFGLRNPELVREVAAWNPDAILLFGYHSWSHLRLIFSRRFKEIPLIFRGDSHLLSSTASRLRQISKILALRLIFHRFRAALCVGQSNRDYLLRFGFSPSAIFHSPHAVDHRLFRPPDRAEPGGCPVRRQFGINPDDQLILFAGKFERKKRPDDLMAAFISAALPNATLLLVGSGELEAELKKMARDHPRIRFASFQNQMAMPRFYAAADLFCLPSHAPDETWGMAVQEALCCGTPVLVSDQVGCHPDLVRPGWNGLVFPAGKCAGIGSLSYLSRNHGWIEKRAECAAKQKRENISIAHPGLGPELLGTWRHPTIFARNGSRARRPPAHSPGPSCG